jgi:hypothetical protein
MARLIAPFLLSYVGSVYANNEDTEYLALLQTQAKVIETRTNAVDPDATIKLDLSTVKRNNLGGFGPDDGPAEVRYGPVVTLDTGTEVDLVVTSDRTEAYNQDTNGKKNNFFGKLNQPSGGSYTYTFSFEESANPGKSVTLPNFAFSFFDVDANKWQEIKESISVCGATSILLYGSSLDYSQDNDCTIVSPLALDGAPNVQDIDTMTDVQKSHTFSVTFADTSSFTLKSHISAGRSKTENRALIFAGQTIAGFNAVPLQQPSEGAQAPASPTQQWAFVSDSQGNIMAIKTAGPTGTLMTEVHSMSKSSNYGQFNLQVGTALPYSSNMDTWSFVMDSSDNLLAIKKGPSTGTGKTEVHRMSKASNYEKFDLQTGTALGYTDDVDNWEFLMDSNDDLLALKKGPTTGTGKTEIHRLSKASNYQSFNLQTGTGLQLSNNIESWSFVMEPNNDLVAILKGPNTGTGKTEFHRLSASSSYQSFNLHTGTPLQYTNNYKSWSFVADKTTGNVMAILKGPQTGTGKTEVHSLQKNGNFQQWNLQTGTALHYSNNQ